MKRNYSQTDSQHSFSPSNPQIVPEALRILQRNNSRGFFEVFQGYRGSKLRKSFLSPVRRNPQRIESKRRIIRLLACRTNSEEVRNKEAREILEELQWHPKAGISVEEAPVQRQKRNGPLKLPFQWTHKEGPRSGDFGGELKITMDRKYEKLTRCFNG